MQGVRWRRRGRPDWLGSSTPRIACTHLAGCHTLGLQRPRNGDERWSWRAVDDPKRSLATTESGRSLLSNSLITIVAAPTQWVPGVRPHGPLRCRSRSGSVESVHGVASHLQPTSHRLNNPAARMKLVNDIVDLLADSNRIPNNAPIFKNAGSYIIAANRHQ